ANDVIYRYLQNGLFEPKPSVATVSNAMDVGNPSNFIRILQIFKHQVPQLKRVISAASIDDETTKQTIAHVYKRYNYILDPHGAVAYKALEDYFTKNEGKGFILETAHPVKFPDVVEEAIGKKVEVPDSAKDLFLQEKHSIKIPASFDVVKEWLMYR
ncbi:MAG: threonine synthase, partial [Bacteroidota bacterium]|nr:threonine synthase [Bacteroidota bacterium]